MTAYKQTELGMIPSDWEVVELGKIGFVEMCKRIFKHQTRNTGEIPFYKIGTFGGKADAYISRELFEEYKNKYPYPKKGDILISAAGTIGRTVVFSNEYSYYQDSNIVWLNIDENKISNIFLNYTYQSIIWDSLEGSTIKRLYNNDLLSKKIILPSKPEQAAIATALSNTDALLAELEKLLVKKQAIKTAAMQQLLTGKTRLPAFAHRSDGTPKGRLKTEWGDIPEDWEVVELGNLCNIQKGELITSDTKKSGSIPVIAGGKKLAYFHNMANRNGKTITISASGASAGFVNFFTQPIFASDCSTISESEKFNIEFIYYSLVNFQMKIYGMQTGGAQPHVQPSDLKPLLIPITNKPEQTAIAQILSDMDNEITALQTRIEKVREIKQGMMQNLLTGKIRLPF